MGQVVGGLPVVEDFIAVVDGAGKGGEEVDGEEDIEGGERGKFEGGIGSSFWLYSVVVVLDVCYTTTTVATRTVFVWFAARLDWCLGSPL